MRAIDFWTPSAKVRRSREANKGFRDRFLPASAVHANRTGSTSTALVRAFGEKDGWDGDDDDFDVEGQRPHARIIGVARDPRFIGCAAPTADLPKPGNSRPACRVSLRGRAVSGKFLFCHGAWAHDAHIAHQHVKELGQLVEARLAQNLADWRDPWIVTQLLAFRPFGRGGRVFLEKFAKPLGGIDDHCSKFQTVKRLATKPHPLVTEYGWSRRRGPRHDQTNDQERREQDDSAQGQHDIDHSLRCEPDRRY